MEHVVNRIVVEDVQQFCPFLMDGAYLSLTSLSHCQVHICWDHHLVVALCLQLVLLQVH